MKNLELTGILRPDYGKKAAKIVRKEGNVPCVLYGGEEVIHFQLLENDTNAFIFTPEVYTIELNIDGKNICQS